MNNTFQEILFKIRLNSEQIKICERSLKSDQISEPEKNVLLKNLEFLYKQRMDFFTFFKTEANG